jgi:hypothetical protein
MDTKYIHRLRRLLASGSPVLFAGGIALAGLAISSVTKTINVSAAIVWPLLLAWTILLLFQMFAEYRKRTFDPALALKFIDDFYCEDLVCARVAAAQALKENRKKGGQKDFVCSDLEDVMDFFETVGFFMQGDQITPEVAHHAFYHWIRGYYSAAKEYLEVAQKEEPSNWEFVKMLFEATNEIERERVRRYGRAPTLLDGAKIVEFLEEEISLSPQIAGKG